MKLFSRIARKLDVEMAMKDTGTPSPYPTFLLSTAVAFVAPCKNTMTWCERLTATTPADRANAVAGDGKSVWSFWEQEF